MCMSKNMGYKNTFTAWIPFYNKYLLGSIAGNKIMGIISGILSFVSICLGIYFYIHKVHHHYHLLPFLLGAL